MIEWPLPVQVRHLGVGERDQLEVLLLAHHQVLVRDDRGLRIRFGVEAVLFETAQPGAPDVLGRARVARRAANHGINEARVIAARQHGPPLGQIIMPPAGAILRASIGRRSGRQEEQVHMQSTRRVAFVLALSMAGLALNVCGT